MLFLILIYLQLLQFYSGLKNDYILITTMVVLQLIYVPQIFFHVAVTLETVLHFQFVAHKYLLCHISKMCYKLFFLYKNTNLKSRCYFNLLIFV